MKEDLACTKSKIERFIEKETALDLIWLEMKLANCDKLLLGCLYRSPNNADNDKEQINMELKASVQYGYCHVLIVGDFNYPEQRSSGVHAPHLDLPKSSWKKGRDNLSLTAHSWITQLGGQTVFGTADGTFDHNV